jgi:hypothetical protein
VRKIRSVLERLIAIIPGSGAIGEVKEASMRDGVVSGDCTGYAVVTAETGE